VRHSARSTGWIAIAASLGLGMNPTSAQSVLIRSATVHTAASAGTLIDTDVLVQDGKIAAIGKNLPTPQGVGRIDARGRELTPGLFAGLTQIGVVEIGLEPTAGDEAAGLGGMRPEFDLALAYNPDSVAVGVTRSGGVTFGLLTPSTASAKSGGSLIAGQGALFRLDGADIPVSAPRVLVVQFGGDSVSLSGGSRAAQYMLLHQAIAEARTPAQLPSNNERLLTHGERLLTPPGQQLLGEFLKARGLVVIDVDRAADIRGVLAFAEREGLRIAIRHGNEAWRVGRELAAAKVPVIVDPFENLPANFDEIGTTMENAARLARAGVQILFSMSDPGADRALVLRQAAGNAVAHGLPWETALAAITRNPANVFGAGKELGSIEVGKRADLVLWSGDPLEVSSLAQQLWLDGRAVDMRSRQTELRDRHIARLKPFLR
jgi:imidazolonepropionase-like amidohydrolase